MFVLFTAFLILAGLVATYITWRLFGSLRSHRISKFAVASGIVGIFLATPCVILLRTLGIDNLGTDVIAWAGYLGLGFVSFLCTFLVFKDVLWMPRLLLKKFKKYSGRSSEINPVPPRPENPGRRGFLLNGMNYGIVAGSFILTGYGLSEAKRIPRVKEVTIPIVDLPQALEGFRIVQITDIHVSPTVRQPFVEGIVEVVNGLKADVIAFTGDLADGLVAQLSDDVAPLSKLQSSYGNFFVTGNHEYYFGALEWVEKVRDLGFTVLLNEHRILSQGEGRLLLAGVTDYSGGGFIRSHQSDPLKALAGAPSTDARVLLAHQPRSIFGAAEAGFDLQISGHTHGGQFFPWNFVIGLAQPYVAGLHKYTDTQIYVSRGTGYWGPPVRVGSPSEITSIQLTSGHAPSKNLRSRS
jgi:predicted MPP superfamily phosphohydrolase